MCPDEEPNLTVDTIDIMQLQSFQYMQAEYDTTNDGLDIDDINEREKLLYKYKYSVIVEGEHNEFDSLDKWIKENLDENSIVNIYFGKTGYNYGFAEFFVTEKITEEKLKSVIPNIYTTYADANPARTICKTIGYGFLIHMTQRTRIQLYTSQTKTRQTPQAN